MGYRELVNRLNRQHPESGLMADGFRLMRKTLNGQPCLFIVLSVHADNVVYPMTRSQALDMLPMLEEFVGERVGK